MPPRAPAHADNRAGVAEMPARSVSFKGFAFQNLRRRFSNVTKATASAQTDTPTSNNAPSTIISLKAFSFSAPLRRPDCMTLTRHKDEQK
jgi:hypothetical protein